MKRAFLTAELETYKLIEDRIMEKEKADLTQLFNDLETNVKCCEICQANPLEYRFPKLSALLRLQGPIPTE